MTEFNDVELITISLPSPDRSTSRPPDRARRGESLSVITLDALNRVPVDEFTATLGAIFEHSPWVPRRAAAARPFASRLDLLDAMRAVVEAAPVEEQLGLIRAHPQLGARGRKRAELTEASSREQRRAGLDACTDAQFSELLRLNELHVQTRAFRTRGSFVEGFRYVWRRPDLRTILIMLFLIGTFGLNFQIFISTMSVKVFHAGASQYGLLTSVMAIGTIAGALLAAGREKPRFGLLLFGTAIFGLGCALAAVAPNAWLFGMALVIIGVSALTFTNSTNSLMQLSTEPAMRGRVMAILLALALGGTPLGAPVVGWVADTFGPRWALAVGAASGFVAAWVGIRYLKKHRQMRVRIAGGRLQFSFGQGMAAADLQSVVEAETK